MEDKLKKCPTCRARLSLPNTVLLHGHIETMYNDEGELEIPYGGDPPDEETVTCAECGEVLDHRGPLSHLGGATLYVNDRELAAILAGLRLLEMHRTSGIQFMPGDGGYVKLMEFIDGIVTDAGRLKPLTKQELDTLVERVNS